MISRYFYYETLLNGIFLYTYFVEKLPKEVLLFLIIFIEPHWIFFYLLYWIISNTEKLRVHTLLISIRIMEELALLGCLTSLFHFTSKKFQIFVHLCTIFHIDIANYILLCANWLRLLLKIAQNYTAWFHTQSGKFTFPASLLRSLHWLNWKESNLNDWC